MWNSKGYYYKALGHLEIDCTTLPRVVSVLTPWSHWCSTLLHKLHDGKGLECQTKKLVLVYYRFLRREVAWPELYFKEIHPGEVLGGTVRAGTHNFANINYNFFPLGWREGVWGILGQATWGRNYWSFHFLGVPRSPPIVGSTWFSHWPLRGRGISQQVTVYPSALAFPQTCLCAQLQGSESTMKPTIAPSGLRAHKHIPCHSIWLYLLYLYTNPWISMKQQGFLRTRWHFFFFNAFKFCPSFLPLGPLHVELKVTNVPRACAPGAWCLWRTGKTMMGACLGWREHGLK